MTSPLSEHGLEFGGNWWRGRAAGYFKRNLTDPDLFPRYSSAYDDRDQSTIWRDALRAWQLHAAIAAGEARLAARLEAEARYREQRRQSLAAIAMGLIVITLTIALF